MDQPEEYTFEIVCIETLEESQSETLLVASETERLLEGTASDTSKQQQSDAADDTSSKTTTRLSVPHFVPSLPSSPSDCSLTHRSDVCTCLKHCIRRPSSMDESQGTLNTKTSEQQLEECTSLLGISQPNDKLPESDFVPEREARHCEPPVDLSVSITLKRRPKLTDSTTSLASTGDSTSEKRCLPVFASTMSAFLRNEKLSDRGGVLKRILFPLILIFSILALVLLHNGSLRTRKTPNPSKFFISGNPFISEFEYGQLKNLWSRISQNEVSFIIYYAPWDSDCIRSRNEIEIVANHYGQQIFFGAINCWWPEGECRKYQNIRRYPLLVAHIRTEGEIEYNGPILASYIIPFLENVMNPVMPIQNEGELLDLRAKHDAVLLGYFNFMESPHQSGYNAYLSTSIKALVKDPWRSVAFTVVTNSRVAAKLKIDPTKDSSLLLFVGNSTEIFTAKYSKPAAILSWIYSRASTAATLKWLNPSGIKSNRISDYIQQNPALILFTPRSFILGISPYYDLLREIVLDYYNCDNSPVIRSLIHRNILRRRLLEDKVSELEERCHELLDEEEAIFEEDRSKRYSDNEDTCCHTQAVKWRSFGGARRGMTKKCLCTSCVHISLPKCPARCSHFDCLSTASRFLDDFEPNSVNNSAMYCNQIKSVYEPKYTSYYKISTTCSGSLSPASGNEDTSGHHWHDVDKYSAGAFSADEKISRMIQDFEIQHCRRLKLGMNYTDLNFPDSSENRQINWRANFTGLGCRTNQTLKFFSMDSSLYPAFAESLGIDVFNVPHSTVALIIDPSNENVHVLNHEILYKDVELPTFESVSTVQVPVNSYSKKSFMEFIKNFTDGTLPRFLRSQLISSSGLCDLKQMIINDNESGRSNVICVPELTALTFTNYVLGKSFDGKDNQTGTQMGGKNLMKINEKDVLVMYYAPWCGFCTSIAHIYLDVARFFAFSNEIVFTRINGDSNDLPWEYTVDRYPTIMIFPAKKRSNSLVYPSNQVITKMGLMQFILKHGQPSVRIQTMLFFCRTSCLVRSFASNHFQRRSLWRAIRHNTQANILNKYEINKAEARLLKSAPKEATKLKGRASQLSKYEHFLRSNIRRLKRLEVRQNLLSYSLLKRVDQFRRLGSMGDSIIDPYTHELSEELFQSVYGRHSGSRNPGKKQHLPRQQQQQLKPLKGGNVASRKVKDKGANGRSKLSSTRRKDEL